jgi:hypothetical protein
MKLIFCRECQDIRKLLSAAFVTCQCGQSGGHYLADGLNAEVWGPCVPLGFNNTELATAVRNRPLSGMGRNFGAFVIPRRCATIRTTAKPA